MSARPVARAGPAAGSRASPDALPIWQGEIERVIAAKNNQAYAEAVRLIVRARGLLLAAGRVADFPAYTANLRTTHKPNLMKMFDERSW